jgi:hypothetical protein
MSTETLTTGDEPAADRRILVDVIGEKAPVRILTVLIGEADRDLNPSEIYEEAGVSSSTFYNHIEFQVMVDSIVSVSVSISAGRALVVGLGCVFVDKHAILRSGSFSRFCEGGDLAG